MEAHRLNYEWLLTYRKFIERSRNMKAQNKLKFNEIKKSSGDPGYYKEHSQAGQSLMVVCRLSDNIIMGTLPKRPKENI